MELVKKKKPKDVVWNYNQYCLFSGKMREAYLFIRNTNKQAGIDLHSSEFSLLVTRLMFG